MRLFRIAGIALALAGAARAQAPDAARRAAGPFPRLAPATLNVDAALQSAAHALFHPARGTWLKLDRTGRRSDPVTAAEIETWNVAVEDGPALGSMVRFRCWPGPDSVVDLALRVEDGGLRAVAPLRPLVVNGAAYPALPAALALAPEVPAATWAPAVSRLVRALVDLEPLMAGRAAATPLDEAAAGEALAALERERPPLLPGAPLPALDAKDEAGASFDGHALAGHAVLFVAASVKHALSREVADEVSRYARTRPGRFRVVWVLADRASALATYRARGGALEGTVLLDRTGSVRDALRVSVLPTLFAFDTAGTLVGYRRAPWPAGADLAEFLDGIPAGDAVSTEVRQSSNDATVLTTASLPVVAPADLLAAWRRLPAPATPPTTSTDGAAPRVTRSLARYGEGCALERVELVTPGGASVDAVARVVVLPDPHTRVDLLVRADGGAAAAAEPLARATAGDRALTHLRPLLAAMSHRGMDTHGPALARLFEALALAGQPTARPAPATSATPHLRLTSPGLPVGALVPALEAPDREGHRVRTAELRGHPALLVLTGEAAPPPELLEAAARGMSQRHGRALVLPLPAEGDLPARLPAPDLPYMYYVDATGHVAARGAWNGPASLQALLDATR